MASRLLFSCKITLIVSIYKCSCRFPKTTLLNCANLVLSSGSSQSGSKVAKYKAISYSDRQNCIVISNVINSLSAVVMTYLQMMDGGSFTDLLSAAMSESGLIDLETSNHQPVVDTGSHSVATSQPVSSVSQQLVSPQLRTNSIIVQRPRLHSPAGPLRPPAVHTSADAQKGVHKIVIRPVPARLPTRQLQPANAQSTTNTQSPIQVNVSSAGQTSVTIVRPIFPLLRTATLDTDSTATIHPQTAPSATTIQPTLNADTLRFAAIRQQLAARLPTGETGMSLQIRPRFIVPQSAAATGNIMQPVSSTLSGRSTLIESSVPSTVVNLVQLPSLSTPAAAVTLVTASSPAGSDSSVVSSTVIVGCFSSVPITTSMRDTTSSISVTSASSNSELSLKNFNTMSQADTRVDSCSPGLLSSAAAVSRCVSTTAVTESADGADEYSSVISNGNACPSTSIEQPPAVTCALTSSASLSVPVTKSDTEHIASDAATSTSAFEADDQVRLVKISVAMIIISKLKL